MSKKDGTIISELNIVIPERYTLSFVGDGSLRLYRLPYNRYHGQDFVIADMSSDTIYKLSKNRELEPLFIRKPSVTSSSPLVVWSSMFITDKFSVLHRATKNESSLLIALLVVLFLGLFSIFDKYRRFQKLRHRLNRIILSRRPILDGRRATT